MGFAGSGVPSERPRDSDRRALAGRSCRPEPAPAAPGTRPAPERAWDGALHQLAAAVAHEIRNPLAAMSNAASLLRDAARPGTQEAQLIEILLEESQRMNRIVGDFLSLARPAAPVVRSCSVESLVFSTVTLLGKDPRFGDRVVLEVDVPSPLPPIRADADRVREALWNLLLNAAQAVGEGGRVSLCARAEAQNGRDGVALHVEDSGPGIPASMRERVFVPFETTKAGGTGLGLAWARQIAEVHGGSLEIEDSALGGARLRLWLAASEGGGPSGDEHADARAGGR